MNPRALTLTLLATHLMLAIGTEVCKAAEDVQPARLLPPPTNARLAFSEAWSRGKLDPAHWYTPDRKWGKGNNGVAAANVHITRDTVNGHEQFVLTCDAHGDQYNGPVNGYGNENTRVGGMVVTKEFFASGRFEVVMKVGSTATYPGAPEDPRRPAGTIPAIWTYAYRYVHVPQSQMNQFVRDVPLYNPAMKRYGTGANEYWSEIDFPELGKAGNFDRALYNAFCQNRVDSHAFDVSGVADGAYHTFTTEWRTKLVHLTGITDAQVVQSGDHWWVHDAAIPFEQYLGNPLKKLGPNDYAAYMGDRADHFIDGRKVAENTRFVPCMAAQLTLGVWLPDWAGKAPWETAHVSFASVRVWQYDDAGDVRGVLTEDVPSNFGRK